MAYLHRQKRDGVWFLIDKSVRPPRWIKLGKIYQTEAKTVLARYQIDQTYLRLDLQRDSKITLKELADDYIADCQGRKGEYTVSLEKHCLDKLCEVYGARQINSITPREIEQHFSAKGYKPTTWDFKCKVLKRAYDLAVKRQYLRTNHMTEIRKPKREELPPRCIEPKVIEKIFKQMRGRVLAYYKLLYYTGMRPSEALRLKRMDIDLGQNRLVVMKSKTKRFRVIPIHEKIVPYIRQLLESSDDYLFPGMLGEHQKSMKMGLRRAVEAAKIKEGGISAYVFRHTFATQVLSKTANLRAVQMLLGHSRSTMTERYAHVLNDQLKEAVDTL